MSREGFAADQRSEAERGVGLSGEGGEPMSSSPPSTRAPAAAMTLITLPSPPSVNVLFKNVRGVGRVKSEMYELWQSECRWRLRAQNPEPVHGSVVILIGVERTNLAADIDNRVKALFDILVDQKVIDDDRYVVGFAAAWSPARDGLARLVILPASNLTAQFQLTPDGAHGGWFIPAPDDQQAFR